VGKSWRPSNISALFWISGSVKQRSTLTLLLVFRELKKKKVMVMSEKSEAI